MSTPNEQYRCILMDPPWQERGGGKIKRGADRHYPLMDVRSIYRTIITSGKWNPDPQGAVLWCWATNNYLKDALWLIDALGFRYITNAVWAKSGPAGLGQWLRGRHELLLLASAGEQPVSLAKSDRKDLTSLIVAPRGRHSEKPPESYELIEQRTHGPRIEFFARSMRPGWTSWGNEIVETEEGNPPEPEPEPERVQSQSWTVVFGNPPEPEPEPVRSVSPPVAEDDDDEDYTDDDSE